MAVSIYLRTGEDYLNLATTLEKARFMDTLDGVMPKRMYSKFRRWASDVEKWESHRDGKKGSQWYLDLLAERLGLNKKYKISK